MTKKERRQIGRIPAKAGVSGGFHAGRRRRGNSLLKQAPASATRVLPFDIVDNASGLVVARNIRTVTYNAPTS